MSRPDVVKPVVALMVAQIGWLAWELKGDPLAAAGAGLLAALVVIRVWQGGAPTIAMVQILMFGFGWCVLIGALALSALSVTAEGNGVWAGLVPLAGAYSMIVVSRLLRHPAVLDWAEPGVTPEASE